MSYLFAAIFLWGAGVAVLVIAIGLWIALLTGDEP